MSGFIVFFPPSLLEASNLSKYSRIFFGVHKISLICGLATDAGLCFSCLSRRKRRLCFHPI